jgi:hypothetical protein
MKRIAETSKKHWKLLKEKFLIKEEGLLKNENMEKIRSDREFHKQKQRDNALKRYQKPAKVDASLPANTTAKKLPLEVEKEKEDLGKSENPFPELGMAAANETANKVWEDKAWRETICMGCSMSEQELKKWMAQFNASVAQDQVSDFNPSKYKKMIRGFINNQKGKGVTVSGVNGSASYGPNSARTPTINERL